MTPPMSLFAHARATLALGLPLIGSSLAQMALHVVDTVMVGWYGVIALAALVLGSSSFFIMFVLGSGFAKAVMPMAAHARAQGDDAGAPRRRGWGCGCRRCSGWLVYPVFWWSGPILLALGSRSPRSRDGAGIPADRRGGDGARAGVAVLQSWLSALGRTQAVLWVTLAAVGLNAGFNWPADLRQLGAFPNGRRAGRRWPRLRCRWPRWWRWRPMPGCLPALRRFRLFQRFWRPDWPALAQVLPLGWPIGLTGLAEGGLFQASGADDGLDRHGGIGGPWHRDGGGGAGLHDACRAVQRGDDPGGAVRRAGRCGALRRWRRGGGGAVGRGGGGGDRAVPDLSAGRSSGCSSTDQARKRGDPGLWHDAAGAWRRCSSWPMRCRSWRWAFCAGCRIPRCRCGWPRQLLGDRHSLQLCPGLSGWIWAGWGCGWGWWSGWCLGLAWRLRPGASLMLRFWR
jgi:hypothetical protein